MRFPRPIRRSLHTSDHAQRTALVTGATDGIGMQTALELARAGMRVILHGRSAQKAEAAREEIARTVRGAQLDHIVFDFESLRAVRSGARELERRYPELHVLVNNAGIYALEKLKTRRGLDLTFQVNHLAPFLLTLSLLPALERGAPSRIINVSSMAHAHEPLDVEATAYGHGFDTREAYSRSKLANLLFTRALAWRLAGKGITVNAVHPGVVATKLLEEGFGGQGGPVRRGAETTVHLALSRRLAEVTGKYFVSKREARPNSAALDDAAAERLWAFSAELVGGV